MWNVRLAPLCVRVCVCVCVVSECGCMRECGLCVCVCNDVVSLSEKVVDVSECRRVVVSCVYGEFKLNFKLGNKLNLLSIFLFPMIIFNCCGSVSPPLIVWIHFHYPAYACAFLLTLFPFPFLFLFHLLCLFGMLRSTTC